MLDAYEQVCGTTVLQYMCMLQVVCTHIDMMVNRPSDLSGSYTYG